MSKTITVHALISYGTMDNNGDIQVVARVLEQIGIFKKSKNLNRNAKIANKLIAKHRQNTHFNGMVSVDYYFI